MMSDFKHLFEPITIGGLEIRNRITLTGHGTGMGRDFKPDERMLAYYETRAKGGTGLIMLGSQQVHPSSPGLTGLLCNYDDTIIPGLRNVAAAIHRHGGRVFGYLSHMGLASSSRPHPLWSASNAYEQRYGEVAHAMTVEEINTIVAAFAAAALRCLEAGMDGIQVHCGHGLLLQQFLSPLTNFRTDEYGGSFLNRLRFPSEVLRAVRAAIGDNVPLGIRCSGDELVKGGLTVEDMCLIVPHLVTAGRLDYVDVSAGTDGDLVSNMMHEPPMGRPFAPFATIARQIKETIDVPVIHATRVHTAEMAEEILARGDADMAGMCRALIADPYLPNKAKSGNLSHIVPCVACEQACFGRLHRGRHISCVGNPMTGREVTYADRPEPIRKQKVVVVGGGPAGLEAALRSAQRGHEVTLIERDATLGGRLRKASLPPGRHEWQRLLEHKIQALHDVNVTLRLGETADTDSLLALKPDIVVLSTGSTFRAPTLPGMKSAEFVSVDNAVSNPGALGHKVLILDYLDRQPAMAAATLLAREGRAVTIATASLHVGIKLEMQNLTEFYRRTHAGNVSMRPLASPVSFADGKITFRNPLTGYQWEEGPFDSIVVVGPGRPNDSLSAPLTQAGITVKIIGDAYAPRDVEAATLEGFEVAYSL